VIRQITIDPAELRRRYDLRIAGAVCRLSTNSRRLGETLCRWEAAEVETSAAAFSMHILVAGEGSANTAPPHFRGMKHVVIASFGEDNLFVFDLARRHVAAKVTEAIAVDANFWDRILLPITMGVLGPAVGVLPVHAACVAMEGEGVLIAGASGAGKSTLSVALAQSGFNYLSDDWTYLAVERGRLLAHGMGVPAKLLPDALQHFPFLARYRVGMALNQEPAYEVPAQEIAAQVESSCAPRWFLFLERSTKKGCHVEPVSPEQARSYVERSVERLPPELDDMRRMRRAIIEQISLLSCWKLSYAGPPQTAVAALQQFFADQRQGVAV